MKYREFATEKSTRPKNGVGFANGKRQITESNGKGIPMDRTSRMARAKKMGFDTNTVYYHGTPSESDFSALQRGSWEHVAGEPFYLADLIQNPKAIQWVPSKNQIVWFTPSSRYAAYYAQRHGKNKGAIYPVYLRKDAIQYEGKRQSDKNVTSNEVYVSDLTAIRSIFAAFDPDKSNDTDLLA